MILITGVIVGLISGCGKEVVKEKEESVEETEENISEKADDTDKTEETEEEEPTQLVYFKDYYEFNFGEKLDEVEPVGEGGNEYGFDESLLGYYTNGIVGLNFRQINGGSIDIDVFTYGYYMGSYWLDILESNQFTFRMDVIQEAGSYETDGGFTYNIPIENGSFTISDRYNTGSWLSLVIGQNSFTSLTNMALTIMDVDGYYSLLDNLIIGKYTKQDDSVIDDLKVTNDFVINAVTDDQLDENMTRDVYYENNQPATDRISKEQYPKYIKKSNIPQSKSYILGDPSDTNNIIIEAKMITSGDGIPDMNTSIGVVFNLYEYTKNQDGNEVWQYRNPIGSKDYGVRFVSFNYEVDGLVGTSEIDFMDGSSASDHENNSDVFYQFDTLHNNDYQLPDCTFIMNYNEEDDTITFDAPYIMKDMNTVSLSSKVSVTKDDVFKAVEDNWNESLNAEYVLY